MVSLDKEQACILELIKASLFGVTPVIPESVNWNCVFELAKAQCIVPLLASCVPAEHRSGWLEIACQSKAHYMRMIYEQNALVELLKANSISFVIFKGTAAALYYPVPSLRTFGDIDLYVPEESFESAHALLEKNGYQFVEENYRHYAYFKNGIEFELHYRISSKSYNNIDYIYLKGLNKAVDIKSGSISFPCLPIFENGLVLLGHIMQHLKASGIGLRQIIDWMMFVHKELDDSSWETHFKALANEAGLEKLAITVTYMCKKWLGLPCDCTWCDSADEEVTDQLFLRILDEGNFGHDRAPAEKLKASIKEQGFFNHLQNVGIEKWPLAQKYAVLRPFAWLFQLCRYAGNGISSLFTGKKVFMKNKHNMSLEELWERLEE